MNLSIYTSYVPITSQEQANRMKQLCIDYGLNYWGMFFMYWGKLNKNNFFGYDRINEDFAIHGCCKNEFKITEQQFIELLKNHK